MGFGSGFGRGFGRGHGYGYGRGFGGGRGGFSGFSCVKFIFFGFNVIFWLLGCAILGIGIWLHVSRDAYTNLSTSFNFLSATVLCIAAGILVLIVGFFGCCGAIMENKCLLITYFVFVVIIFIMEVVVGIMAFVYKSEIERVVGQELQKGIKSRYPPMNSDKDEDGLRATWFLIQSNLKCCGVYNYTDWFNSNGWPENNYVPHECCKINATDCNTGGNSAYWHHKGCFTEILQKIRQNLYIIGIVAICIGVIQILGLVASMAMVCCLRQEKYYDE